MRKIHTSIEYTKSIILQWVKLEGGRGGISNTFWKLFASFPSIEPSLISEMHILTCLVSLDGFLDLYVTD